MTHAERITSTALIGTPSPSQENDAVVGCSKLATREKKHLHRIWMVNKHKKIMRAWQTHKLEDVSGSPLKSLENKPHWKKKNEPYTATKQE